MTIEIFKTGIEMFTLVFTIDRYFDKLYCVILCNLSFDRFTSQLDQCIKTSK